MSSEMARDRAESMPSDLPRLLGILGYPGFAHLAALEDVANPAEVFLMALRLPVVPARVIEALPWLLITYADLDWGWLVAQARLSAVQNRLGFLVGLARQVAERRADPAAIARLRALEDELDKVRLPDENTIGQALTSVERAHLRMHRSASAKHWNLLTGLRVEDLRWANAGPSAVEPSR